jgi:NAD(P)-dependent dehydrogenase (short-subunit alcohol dehydrogenase family)
MMAPSGLAGKTVLVTGGSRGIGRAIVELFASEGADVTFFYRGNADAAQDVVTTVRGSGRDVNCAQVDVTDAAASRTAVEQLADRAGRIDVLVNNAGIFPGSTTPTVDEAMFDEVYAVNVKAPFFLTAAIAPEMTARGSGSIINLGSWVARLGIPVGALYASTKGAMETLTRAWAAEFGSPSVRVNAISPGVVRTPIENDPAAAMMNGTPYGTFGTPDAIAHAAVYLASDESQFVNGTVIDVDGGRVGVAVIASDR